MRQEDVLSALAAYPAWHVVDMDDLRAEDKDIWAEHHVNVCPGVAAGRFSPRGNGHAITLIRSTQGKTRQMVLLSEKSGKRTILSPAQEVAYVSVVRTLDMPSCHEVKKANGRPRYSAVGYEAIEAGEIVFFWSGRKFDHCIESE